MKDYYRKRISAVLFYVSTVLIIGGILLFVPVIIGLIYGEGRPVIALLKGFVLPGTAMVVVGMIIKLLSAPQPLSLKDSMFICTLSWILLTVVGAIPFIVLLDVNYLDACFETMSGFTTTGITMFTGLDSMPRSILFWRAMTQWIGGLGILSMFVLIGLKGGAAANKLFLAEGHKIAAQKPSPGMFNTAKILWTMYILFTVAQIVILMALRLDFFDAITHAFTTISTGGYSIYDQSIAQYRLSGFSHYHLIELTFMLFMLFGGISFFIHYRFWTGDFKSLVDNTEIKYFWGIFFGAVGLILLSYIRKNGIVYTIDGQVTAGSGGFFLHLKDTGFQVTAILSTTGYATRDIGSAYFSALAKQLFLVLMVIGGCAGSTGGGFKVIRVAILTRLVRNRIYRLNSSRFARIPMTVDNQIVEDEEITRIFTIFFMWILLLLVGGGITAYYSDLSGWQSFSGMFSALGNIGPCYMSVQEMIQLHPVVKITYMFGMLAGRLEIIPILLIFSRRFFK
jgi:trk system potassium uptake protein TrkH